MSSMPQHHRRPVTVSATRAGGCPAARPHAGHRRISAKVIRPHRSGPW